MTTAAPPARYDTHGRSLVTKWGYAELPEVVTAFIRGAKTPEDRANRWAVLILGAVRRWHESLDAEGYEPIETPRAQTTWRISPEHFERNLLGLIVTGRAAPKRVDAP